MNDHAITLARESLDLLEPIAAQAGAAFYADLGSTDPALEHRLRVEMGVGTGRLTALLDDVVTRLDAPEGSLPWLRARGRELAMRGLSEPDYRVVFGALLRTLKAGLGVAYTAEVEEASQTLYDAVASSMREGATIPA